MIRLLYRNADGSLAFREFDSGSHPEYGILSHTWNQDNTKEVTFDDIEGGRGITKPGYRKVKFCETRTAADGLRYFWIDSCCINRRSEPELSEAINSMFRWYEKASKCYVYLEDVPANMDSRSGKVRFENTTFRTSRWFTRGWTLQELLAPLKVEFFSGTDEAGRTSVRLGNKLSLETLIHEATGISREALQGAPLTDFSVEERMLWAAERKTKRDEDAVYSLLGIFGVTMPLIYGEGKGKALRRLRNEIGISNKAQNMPATDTAESYTTELPPSTLAIKECRTELIEALRYDRIDNRYEDIEQSHGKTCEWLLEHSTYRNWLYASGYYEQHGFFWIKGKPGSGKSTVTKFALTHVAPSLRGGLLLSFFFNARGTDLEKSVVGLYRSFIAQVLGSLPDEVISEFVHRPRFDATLKTDHKRLKLLLKQMLQLHQADIVMIIDALDECSEDDIRDMIDFLEELGDDAIGRKREFRVLFSSRHYPNITARRSSEIILEDQSHHTRDIEQYVSSKFKALATDEGRLIREEICQRSSGIFLWVVLVVKILNKLVDNGQDYMLHRKLRELPSDLHDLFQDMLIRDVENMDEMRLCLQWTLWANRPLNFVELYFAIRSGLEEVAPFQQNEEDIISPQSMVKFILSSSKGLVQVSQSSDRFMQFIHESVRDFLLKDHGLGQVWPELKTNTIGFSHDQLKQCCWNYILRNSTEILRLHSRLPPLSMYNSAEALSSRSFLEYSVDNMFAHADLSQREGVNQTEFLNEVVLEKWARANDVVKTDNVARFSPDLGLLPIFAFRNYCSLIDLIALDKIGGSTLRFKKGFDVNARDGRYGTALQAGVEGGHDELVELLLKWGADVNAQGGIYGTALQVAVVMNNKHKTVELLRENGANVSARGGRHGSALQAAAAMYNHKVVKLLLNSGANVNPQGGPDGTALQAAARRSGNSTIIDLLLKKGADVNAQGGEYGTALQAAAAIHNNHEIVELLLRNGADVNAKRGRYGTALQAAAAIHNNHEIVELLLKNGADVNAQGGRYGTALHAAAAMYDNFMVVELLLRKGADVNAQCGRYSTALQVAVAMSNSYGIVELLLKSGANVNAQGGIYGTALQAAARRFDDLKIVELLLEKGADVNVQGGKYGSALRAAVALGKYQTVELLRSKGAR